MSAIGKFFAPVLPLYDYHRHGGLHPPHWSSRQFGGDAGMENITGLGDMIMSLLS